MRARAELEFPSFPNPFLVLSRSLPLPIPFQSPCFPFGSAESSPDVQSMSARLFSGKHLAEIWRTSSWQSGGHRADICWISSRQSSGKSAENPPNIRQTIQRAIWQTSDDIWRIFSENQLKPGRQSGRYLVYIWQIFGGHLANLW